MLLVVVLFLIQLSCSRSQTLLFLLKDKCLMLDGGVDVQVIIAFDLTISYLAEGVKDIWLREQFFKLVISFLHFCLIQNYIRLWRLKLLDFFLLFDLFDLCMRLLKLATE